MKKLKNKQRSCLNATFLNSDVFWDGAKKHQFEINGD